MNKLNKLSWFVAVVIFTFTSSVSADEVLTPPQTAIKISLATSDTDFSIDMTNAAAVPVPIQTVQGVDPLVALTGVIIGYMAVDKISSTAEQAEQKKKIPHLLEISETINPHLLLKNQFNSEIIKYPKWADGRSYQLDIAPEYHLNATLNTIRMVFKYHLKASKPNTKSESTKANIYIFHNLEQETSNPEKIKTWEEANEEKLKNTFLQSAILLTDAFSNIDVNQTLNSDFLIATTFNDEKLRGFAIKQDHDWLWLLDQNKNIYILKPKRTFVLKAGNLKTS